jgi:endonuclease-3
MTKKRRRTASEVVRRLKEGYPEAACSLSYRKPIQLVVATILSAQSTDERVNLVTPGLFRKYPSIRAFAAAQLAELEELIKPVGLYRAKAKNIIALARTLSEEHGSRVPKSRSELEKLPGIGRKSANVIKGELYGEPEGIAVDTHVARLSYRLGWTRKHDPKKIEEDLMATIGPDDWVLISHLLIHHGRAVCKARRPDCSNCDLLQLCPQRGVKTA